MEKTILMRKKLLLVFFIFTFALIFVFLRLIYINIFMAEFLRSEAYEQQTRDRLITPTRGNILDRNLQTLVTTEPVSAISVINAQVQDSNLVATKLSQILELDFEATLEKVEKRVALNRIKPRVPLNIAEQIRDLELAGVVIDEDIKRIYIYENMAAQVIGFVGGDNQGIIGLEAKYDEYLRGTEGRILTETDARGRETEDSRRFRIAPANGYHLVTNLDFAIQQYAEQVVSVTVGNYNASRGSIVVMNPSNGEILAMANYPNFDLNEPFEINNPELKDQWDSIPSAEQMNHLNGMWRNFIINDTYEPGSTFKVLTAAMAMENGFVNLDSTFICNGFHMVGGRPIRCWRFPRNHGSVTFLEGMLVSCNPVFMVLGERLGAEMFYQGLASFGLKSKTGIDLPGEANSIMHPLENVGPVELATMSFGQSFQITPMQLITSISTVINGGYTITPHVGAKIIDDDFNLITDLSKPKGERIVSEETAAALTYSLEKVVFDGTGNKAYVQGFRIGGKTATSEKLPRRSGNYIASMVGFAPAENPQIIALVLIDEPRGAYYGGQVAAPMIAELFSNILPNLIEVKYYEAELENVTPQIEVPDIVGSTLEQAQELLGDYFTIEILGEAGSVISFQYPPKGSVVNANQAITVFME
ncbi:MAG: penicillin-binding transpeptidase domain-containing protein [Defluviitaleaceae bacterium]|nr:penicillin-binding transpeptidase domain-containing protein [Defluviitaleaceae bacterium]